MTGATAPIYPLPQGRFPARSVAPDTLTDGASALVLMRPPSSGLRAGTTRPDVVHYMRGGFYRN